MPVTAFSASRLSAISGAPAIRLQQHENGSYTSYRAVQLPGPAAGTAMQLHACSMVTRGCRGRCEQYGFRGKGVLQLRAPYAGHFES